MFYCTIVVYDYKNNKIKIYKINAALWYNKMCSSRGLTPNYIYICIKDKNIQSQSLLRCNKTPAELHHAGFIYYNLHDARKHENQILLYELEDQTQTPYLDGGSSQ